MRALKIRSPRVISIENVPEPILRDGDDVKIRIRYGMIASDEYHLYQGIMGSPYLDNGMGCEFVGSIVELGADAAKLNLHVGDVVSAWPFFPCMQCPSCQAGKFNLCLDTGYFQHPGAFAEYIVVKSPQVVRLPMPAFNINGVMFWRTMGCLHGIEQADVRVGQKVLILGGGVSGQLLVQLAKMRGAAMIAVSDPNEEKRSLALKMGATHLIDPQEGRVIRRVEALTENLGFDCIIDASGNADALNNVISMAARGGTIVLFSFYDASQHISVNLEQMYYKEVTIRSSFIPPHAPYYSGIVPIMQSLDYEPLIGRIFSMDDVKEAMNAYASKDYQGILLKM